MDRKETMDDRRLTRYLHGELPPEEAERVRERLARDPTAAARLRELKRLWEGLELAPADGAPPGFAARLAARAAEENARRAAPFGPAWTRAAAGAALAAGVAAGAALGLVAGAAGGPAPSGGGVSASGEESVEWVYAEEASASLAESYWSALAEADPAAEEEGEPR